MHAALGRAGAAGADQGGQVEPAGDDGADTATGDPHGVEGVRERTEAGEDLVGELVERVGQGLRDGVDAPPGAVGGAVELVAEPGAGDRGAVGLLARGALAAGDGVGDPVPGAVGRGGGLVTHLPGGALGLVGDLAAGGPGDGCGVPCRGADGLVAVDRGRGLLADAVGGGVGGGGRVLDAGAGAVGGLRRRGVGLTGQRLPGRGELVARRPTGGLGALDGGVGGDAGRGACGLRVAGGDRAVLADLAVIAVHDHLSPAVVGDDLHGAGDRLGLGRGLRARTLRVVLLDVPAVLGGHHVAVGHQGITWFCGWSARTRTDRACSRVLSGDDEPATVG